MGRRQGEVQLVVRINQFEADIKALKAEYDQYFMGIIRIPPASKHRLVKRTLAELEKRPINNTTLRFRYQQIKSRLISYQTLWRRTLHQIETGTYRRDKYRLERRMKESGAAAPTDDEAQAPKGKKQAKGKPKSKPKDRIDSIYDDFIKGRESTGEPTANVSREKLAKFIQSHEETIKKKYGDRQVDFKVVIEGGKTKLRAVLKK